MYHSSTDYSGRFHGPIPPNRNSAPTIPTTRLISNGSTSGRGPSSNGGLGRSISLREERPSNQHFHYVEAEVENHRNPSQTSYNPASPRKQTLNFFYDFLVQWFFSTFLCVIQLQSWSRYACLVFASNSCKMLPVRNYNYANIPNNYLFTNLNTLHRVFYVFMF